MPSFDQSDKPVGAYSVVLAPDLQVLLIEANGGRLYLPGGRLEAGESPETTLIREIREECGCGATLLGKIGEATQPVYGGRYVIRAHYYQAELDATLCRGEHPSFWLATDEAMRRVHRGGDAWAIERALDRKFAYADAREPLRTYARG